MAILGIQCSDKEFLQLELYFNNNKKSGETMSEFYADIILRKACRTKNINNENKQYEEQSIFYKSIVKK